MKHMINITVAAKDTSEGVNKMYQIKYDTGKVVSFKTEQERKDFIFDKGFKQIENALYFEVEDGKIRKIGMVI
jgi:hypothetical protein